MSQQRAQAVDAPAVAGTTKRVPVIDRVTPELPWAAEIVRRDTGDKPRSVLFVQQEQLRVGPHVARIGRDKKRQVADQAHTLGAGIFLQALPLTEQQELREPNLIDLVPPSSCRRTRQGRRSTLDQFCRPFEVIGILVLCLQRPEQSVIFQPMRLVVAELIDKRASGLRARRR